MISTNELSGILYKEGASLVGFGDISALGYGGFASCVAIAVKLPARVLMGIAHGPTEEYYIQYQALNQKLDKLAGTAARWLEEKSCRALAQTTTVVAETPDHRTPMPHKTCATRAGLGWIGKSALLVTEEYGPAVRLSSVLTDAVFDHVGEPVNGSRCGSCTACKDACPGEAIKGALWDVGVHRESLVDVESCRRAARALALERTGHHLTLCGKCIEVCPYARAYSRRSADCT